MRRHALIALVVFALALSVSASPGASDGDVRKVAVDTAWANIRAQYGKVWTLLHPRYQRVVGRTFWEACQRKRDRRDAGVEWLSIKATDDYPDRVTLPLLGRVSVTAVSIEAKVDYLGTRRTIRDTVYWIKLNGAWRGLWDPETYRAYRAKRCPA